MKAPAVQYLKPDTLEECLAALAEYGDEAEVLAGGQSLMPMLNLRLAGPTVLVDIGGLSELRAMSHEADHMVVGSLQTHANIASSDNIKQHLPLLAQAAPHIAHVAIRSRGTIGGSVALADPAAEWPACCLALDAKIELASSKGTRRIPADDFFLGIYSTERQPDELITAIRFPIPDIALSHVFDEVSRRRGDFAIAGLAFCYRLNGSTMANVRLALLGVADRPILARNTMAALESVSLSGEAIKAAAKELSAELDPPHDPAYPADYRRRVARTLLERTLINISPGGGHAH
jgi:carbon-monoxide dehydrogenase medium subunit